MALIVDTAGGRGSSVIAKPGDDMAGKLAQAAATGVDLELMPGTYVLTSGLTWDATTHSVRGLGDVRLDFTGMTSGTAITVTGQAAKGGTFAFTPEEHRMSGIKITGPDTDATTVDAISISDTVNASHANFDHLFIYGFRDQVSLRDNTWCVDFSNCIMGHAHRRIINVEAVTNAGESYSFRRCTLYSSSNAAGDATAYYSTTASNADTYFVACSFDYNNIEIDHNSGILNLIGCHLENNQSRAMVRLKYTGGFEHTTFTMIGGTFSPTESNPSSRPSLIDLDSTGGDHIYVDLRDVKAATFNKPFEIVRNTGLALPTIRLSGGDYVAGANGATSSVVLPSLYLNSLHNGDFETGTLEGWADNGAGVTWSVQSGTVQAGTYALKAAGTGITSSPTLTQRLACAPGQQLFLRFYASATSITGGSMAATVRWFANDGTSVIRTDTLVTISANQSMTEYRGRFTAPAGAVTTELRFLATDLNGNVFVDTVYAHVVGAIGPAVLNPKVAVYDAAGSYTWTRPAGITAVSVVMLGGGGSGGSGPKRASGTASCGGGSGGGGGWSTSVLPATMLGNTENVTVGAGAAGGAAVSANDTNGNAGTAGGASSFGSSPTKVRAVGGSAGGAGGTSAPSAAGGGGGVSSGGSGTTPVLGATPTAASGAQSGSGGGGSGGGISATPAAFAGGAGGGNTSTNTSGGSGGAIGTAGSQATGIFRPSVPYGGWGGGGGGASITGNAGAGADGLGYGAGGGGGGAALNSVGDSGAGGAGQPGIVVVITQ